MTFEAVRRTLLPKDRERLAAAVKRYLMQDKAILFAYIHGSFAEDRPFRDVDIAIYLDERSLASEDMHSPLAYELALETGLDAILVGEGCPVTPDVRILNYAPLSFRYGVIKMGLLLFARDDDLRVDFEVGTLTRYFDFAPFRKRYLQEVFHLGA